MLGTDSKATLLAAVLTCAFAGAASAENARSNLDDFLLPTQGVWVDVGAGASIHPHAIGSSANVIDPVPVLELQAGPDLHLSLDDGLTWTPVHFGAVALGPVLEFREDYNSPRLTRGLRNSSDWEAGGVVRWETSIGDFEGRLRQSLDGGDTSSADVSFDTGVPVSERFALGLELRASWSNEAFTISTRRGRGRPPVVTKDDADFYAVGAQLAAVYRLDPNWRLIGLAALDRLVGSESGALDYDTRNVPTVSVVATRRFRVR